MLWAAGVNASSLSNVLQKRTAVQLDKSGRVHVSDDLSVPGYPNLFVIGDMAHLEQDGTPLPGVAQVAIQGGTHVAKQILRRMAGKKSKPFRYIDRGNMATIGRAAAVADLRGLQISGYIAWLMWLVIHILFLVGFENRISVLAQWAYSYLTYGRSVRLIIDENERFESPEMQRTAISV